MVGYLCILVRWIIYHIYTLLGVSTLLAIFYFSGGSSDQQLLLTEFAASSCFNDVLHDLLFVPIFWVIPLVGGFFSPSLGFLLSLFGVGFFSLGFLYCLWFTEIALHFFAFVHGYLSWPHCQDPLCISS